MSSCGLFRQAWWASSLRSFNLSISLWPSLSAHEVTTWLSLKNEHLMCVYMSEVLELQIHTSWHNVLQLFIVGEWLIFGSRGTTFSFVPSFLFFCSLPCTLTWKPLSCSHLGFSGGHVLSFALTVPVLCSAHLLNWILAWNRQETQGFLLESF